MRGEEEVVEEENQKETDILPKSVDQSEQGNTAETDPNEDPDAMDIDVAVDIDDIFTRVRNMNPETAESLRHLVGFIRQDDLNNE